jgi:hypothetical protein
MNRVPESMDPYRSAARRDRPGDEYAELVCTAANRETRSKPGVAVIQLLFLPMTAATLLAALAGPREALCGTIVVATLVAWGLHRARRGHECVLRIEAGELSVQSHRKRGLNASMPLSDLADVALDTKAIRPLSDGANAIPGMRFVESRVGPEIDVSRIVLVRLDGTSAPLLEKYIAHMDAAEWVGRIRMFLRKHGWVPEDERETASSFPD